MPVLWPVESGRDCAVPSVGRTAVVPLIGHRPALGSPPFFDPMDPLDVDLFQFDWSTVAFPGDAITDATITSEPPIVVISAPIVFGQTVQAFIGPLTGPVPETIDLNCSATFVSGRVLDWGVEISVQKL
jgi:hypothetical protein